MSYFYSFIVALFGLGDGASLESVEGTGLESVEGTGSAFLDYDEKTDLLVGYV